MGFCKESGMRVGDMCTDAMECRDGLECKEDTWGTMTCFDSMCETDANCA